MKKYILSLALVLVALTSMSQTTYISIPTGGTWNTSSNAMWDSDFDGIGGDGIPGPLDDVYLVNTSGNVTVTSNVEVKDLHIVGNIAGNLRKGGFGGPWTITIHGQLMGDDGLGSPSVPTVDVVNDASLSFVFDGSSLTGSNPAITSWGNIATLLSITFNPASSAKIIYIDDLSIEPAGTLTVSNGTLSVNTSIALQGAGIIDVRTGTTLNIEGSIDGGSTSTNFPTVNINGTVTVGASAYLNVNTINLNSGGILNVTNNQTNGWWHDLATAPTFTPNINSTVNYNRGSVQTVSARTYGNLSVTSGGGAVTKNLSSTGTLYVQGNLTVGSSTTFSSTSNINGIVVDGNISNNGTWTTSDTELLTLNGSTTTGTGILNFNGNTTISGAMSIANDVTIGAATGILNLGANNVSFGQGLTNNNTLISTGTVTFDGTLTQSIAGTSTTFENITINNSSGVTLSSPVNVRGVLTLSASSILNCGGNLTLLSDATGDASIAQLGAGASVNGTYHVQRFIDDVENYRYIASPVVGADLGDLQSNGVPITGSFSDVSPANIDGVLANNTVPSVYTWDAGGQAWSAVDNTGSVTTTSLTNGVGYSLYTFNASATADVTTRFSGTYPTNGAISLSNSWNLIGNPYPSGIDWTLVTLSGGASSTMFVKDNNGYVASAGNFVSYTQSGVSTPAGFDGVIASGQSFWVESTGTGTVTIDESDKATSTRFFRAEAIPNILRIQMHNTDATIFDETVIVFNDAATNNYDNVYDAKKRRNDQGTFNIFSLDVATETIEQVIQTVPTSGCNKIFKINMDDVTGSYSLKFRDLNTFDFATTIVLKDNLLGGSVAVDANTTYSFDIDGTNIATYEGRFEVHFSEALINTNLNLSTIDNCSDEVITISIDNSQQGINYTLLSSGIEVGKLIGNGSAINFNVAKSLLVGGINDFDVYVENIGCSANATTIASAVSFDYVPVNGVSSVVGGSSCGKSVITISADGAPVNGYYRWYSSIDAVESIPGENGASYTTGLLADSKTFFVSVVNEMGCESSKTAVEANIIDLPTSPQVIDGAVCEGGVVSLTGIGGVDGNYRWYTSSDLSSAPISGAVNSVFETVSAGDYFVSIVNSNGCESDRILVTSTIYEAPIAEFSANGNMLTSSSLTGNQWYKDSVLIEGATSYEYEVIESGNYAVKVSNGNCSLMSIYQNMQITATIGEIDYDEVLIYPNPIGNEDLSINFGNSSIQFEKALVMDSKGSVIHSVNLRKSDSELKINFNLYETGIYYINLINNNNKFVYKVLKK